jgi:DNA polymerase/3'-5' exonuclease PolX
MKNYEIATMLREISILFEMDEFQFKPRAYEKAAIAIEAMQENIEEQFLELGIAQARRGWATARNVVNTKTLRTSLRP